MTDRESRLLAWWQLLRAGNVFTAMSNVVAGYLITQGSWQPLAPLAVLVTASSLLYLAGMILNDVFDAQLDAIERPERPIPSGRISRSTAATVGWALLGLGVLAGGWAGILSDAPHTGIVVAALATCILLYNVAAKNSFAGPWVMGACRMLNVSLGIVGAATSWQANMLLYALAIGLYTVGLTYFARSENEAGWKWDNSIGAGLIAVATFGICWGVGRASLGLGFVVGSWLLLNGAIWLGTAGFASEAATPTMLRSTVGRLIIGFILLDALAVGAMFDVGAGWMVLGLLLPTWIASRFASMT